MKKFFVFSLIIVLIVGFLGCVKTFDLPDNLIQDSLNSESSKTPDNNIINQSVDLAIWNIGHFDNGVNPDSYISPYYYDSKLSSFREFVYEDIDADTIGLVEYSRKFGTSQEGDKAAREVLFSDYDFGYIGEQRNYSCNALYSKINIKKYNLCEFECNKDAEITHTSAIKASDYYYISTDIPLENDSFTLVLCHLAYDSNNIEVCKNQMRELVEKFSNTEKVVFMGDWNCKTFECFDIFTDAGYKLANNDSGLVTCPASSNPALDNIIYKGVSLTNFQVHQTDLSDHYAISCTISP